MPNDAETIQALAIQAAGTIQSVQMPDGRQFIIHPAGFVHKDVSLPQNVKPPLPTYIKEVVTVQTAASLVDYIERFKTDNTVVFADIDSDMIEAVIDYHSDGSVKAPVAGITSHRASLELKKSQAWSIWNHASGSMARQAEFAKFIEENSEDILSPAGADLLEMVLDLEKTKNIRVVRKMRTAGSDDGASDHSIDTGGTELPSIFHLMIPVYFGEAPVAVKAFTRDALSNDKIITIGIKLARTEMIRQGEFLRISKAIADATGVTMIAGSIPDFRG